jgi:hypothetical protein
MNTLKTLPSITASLSLIVAVVFGQTQNAQQSAVERVSVLPSDTDSAIRTLNTPHVITVNRDIIISKKMDVIGRPAGHS